MNNGAFVFENNILTNDEILEAKELALKMADKKSSVLGGSKYADYRWFQVNLDQDWNVSQKILSNLGVEKAELLVFYYLEPGASIHPHRDLSGAGLNNRLRFHVPVVTNPDVDFRVSSERISMAPGDLWCLDTSYKHAVTNGGTETRVHIVVECYITPEIRSRVPNNLATKLHSAAFVLIMASLFARSVIVNTFKDRAYLRDQFSMIAKFIGWRFLRTRPPE